MQSPDSPSPDPFAPAAPPVPAAPPMAAAPPTMPGPLRRSAARWPTALGIVLIVLGAVSLLMQAFTILSTGMMGMFAGVTANGPADAMIAAMAKYRPLIITAAALAILAALALIVGGIALAGRRAWSSGLLRTWAVVKILLVAGTGVVTFFMQQAQFAAMQSDPAFSANPAAGAMTSIMPAITGLFNAAIGWALPVFVLIWLCLPKVRAEIARWRSARG